MPLGRPVTSRRRKALMLTSLLLITVATVTAAVLFDLLHLGISRPDLYNPEREALIEADWQLSQSVPHGPAAGSMTAPVHPRIDGVIDWLDKAQGVQTEHRQRIAALRNKVQELDAADRAVRADVTRREQIYREINGELKFLIDRYGDAPPRP